MVIGVIMFKNILATFGAMLLKIVIFGTLIGQVSIIFGLSNVQGLSNIQIRAQMDHARQLYYQDLKSKPWGAVAEKYINFFEAEEEKLIKEFLALVGASDTEWEYFKEDCEESFARSEGKKHQRMQAESYSVPSNLKNVIKKHLQQSHLNPDLIITGLIGKEDKCPDSTYMCASQSTIGISKKCCDNFMADRGNDCDNAIIMHEIAHILHHDCYNGTMIRWYFDDVKKRMDKKDIDAFMLKFGRLKEKRADILGSLVDINYATRLCQSEEYAANNPKDTTDYSSDVHDSPKNIYAYMKKLLDDMRQPEPIIVNEMHQPAPIIVYNQRASLPKPVPVLVADKLQSSPKQVPIVAQPTQIIAHDTKSSIITLIYYIKNFMQRSRDLCQAIGAKLLAARKLIDTSWLTNNTI